MADPKTRRREGADPGARVSTIRTRFGRPCRWQNEQDQADRGRKLEVVSRTFAATEADLWLYVPDEGLAIVGDLVVDIVPFMDTACVDGWKKALGEVEAIPS